MAKKTTSTQVATQELPAWAQQYYSGILTRGEELADQPYQTYDAPRVAGFTPEQLQAFDMVQQGIGSYQPYLDQSSGILDQTMRGPTGLSQAMPYLTEAAKGSALNAANPALQRGISSESMDLATPYLKKAGSMSAVDSAQPYLTSGTSRESLNLASPFLQRAGTESAATAAQPYMSAGAQTFPGAVSDYMNPYNDAVTNRIGELAGRNLRENILPGVNRTFIGGGTFGGSRSAEFNARAVRDAQEAALAEQNKALQAGYGQSADIFAQDAARQVQLAQAAGQLSESDLQRSLAAGKSYADIANQLASNQLQAASLKGQLTSADIASQTNIGKNYADIASDIANRNLTAGATAGQLSTSDLNRKLAVGQGIGELGNANVANQLKAAGMYSDLGEEQQKLNANDISAVSQVGSAEQALNQKSLDTAYADFMRQQNYPMDTLTKLSQLGGNLQIPMQTTTTTTGAPPSTLSSVAGIGASVLGTIGATGGFGQNGWLSGITGGSSGAPVPKKRGGSVRYKRPQKQGLGWLKEMH